MMNFKAHIDIMPHQAILDPQGKAITQSMKNIGLPEITEVRMGKHVELEVQASSEEEARDKVKEACEKLLINPITETYKFELESAS